MTAIMAEMPPPSKEREMVTMVSGFIGSIWIFAACFTDEKVAFAGFPTDAAFLKWSGGHEAIAGIAGAEFLGVFHRGLVKS